MAGDVEKAIVEIAQQHGGHDEPSAKAFVADLKKSGRYQADVY
jgi:sulfite reductase (NADPH) flavoprotein alpha-component